MADRWFRTAALVVLSLLGTGGDHASQALLFPAGPGAAPVHFDAGEVGASPGSLPREELLLGSNRFLRSVLASGRSVA